MKSIKNFEKKKISNTYLSSTQGGDFVTEQTWGGKDLRVGETIYTNRLDSGTGNNDIVKF